MLETQTIKVAVEPINTNDPQLSSYLRRNAIEPIIGT